MASAVDSSITIDRVYFDTLVRRAKFNTESFENNGQAPVYNVTISQVEYDILKETARQYENLRRNLLRGGVGEETVDLLSKDDHTLNGGDSTVADPSRADMTEDGGAALSTAPARTSPARNHHFQPRTASYSQENGNGYQSYNQQAGGGYPNHNHSAWANGDAEVDEEEDVFCDGESPAQSPVGANYVKPQAARQQFERQCNRTLQLSNLPEGVTHADITNIVRGGVLLDIFLRSHERSATVSFLHALDAKRFYDHIRRNDLYIKNKRVEIRWADRQFILPGHVAGKIAMGASRNLVIRRYDGRHTEENIREDLDHIHNLIVVKVEFSGGSCYISLNSVHNAIYARTCMLSRFKYKGTKIEWDVDECAQPYALQPVAKPRKEAPPPKKSTVTNRFQLLNLDEDDEDEISTAFQSKKSVGIAA